jgi:hypothetical protein
MRHIVATAWLLMLLGGARISHAASAYDDVPTDHWTYSVLDCLSEEGVLEGYPGGFFCGDRVLTRYEFAQAVARLLDTMELEQLCPDVKECIDMLRTEFSDQLYMIDKPFVDPNSYDMVSQNSTVATPASASEPGHLREGSRLVGLSTVEEDGIRYEFQLQKRGAGPRCLLVLKIVNTSGKPMELHYDTNERFDFRVSSGSELRWNYNNNRFFVQVAQTELLAPGEGNAIEFRAGWDGTDNPGRPLVGQTLRFEAVHLTSGQPVLLEFAARLPAAPAMLKEIPADSKLIGMAEFTELDQYAEKEDGIRYTFTVHKTSAGPYILTLRLLNTGKGPREMGWLTHERFTFVVQEANPPKGTTIGRPIGWSYNFEHPFYPQSNQFGVLEPGEAGAIEYRVQWDGTDYQGKPLPAGRYRFEGRHYFIATPVKLSFIAELSADAAASAATTTEPDASSEGPVGQAIQVAGNG